MRQNPNKGAGGVPWANLSNDKPGMVFASSVVPPSLAEGFLSDTPFGRWTRAGHLLDEATQLLEQASKLDPASAQIREHLRQVHQVKLDHDLAKGRFLLGKDL